MSVLRPYAIARCFSVAACRAAAGAEYRRVRDRRGGEHLWTDEQADPLGVALTAEVGMEIPRPTPQTVAFRLCEQHDWGDGRFVTIWGFAIAFNAAWDAGKITPRTLATALGVGR